MLLLDNSAWARIVMNALDDERAAAVGDLIERDELATCLPFLLEAGYSARSATHLKEIMDDLDLFPRVRITNKVEKRAAQAQRELAAVGHHRLAPIDVMIASCAHEAGAGVLHYDSDYDILATHTNLRFHSEWLAPAGTL
ncbi:MAG TPA: PIN domain-containing protein [Solirubrobacteraceae bacterium]